MTPPDQRAAQAYADLDALLDPPPIPAAEQDRIDRLANVLAPHLPTGDDQAALLATTLARVALAHIDTTETTEPAETFVRLLDLAADLHVYADLRDSRTDTLAHMDATVHRTFARRMEAELGADASPDRKRAALIRAEARRAALVAAIAPIRPRPTTQEATTP